MTTAPQPEIATSHAEYQYEIRLVRIDPAGGPTIQINLPIGARIVHGFVALEDNKIVRSRNEESVGRLVPMLVVVVDALIAQVQPRRFVLLRRGEAIGSGVPLTPVATFTSPDGQQVLTLLEEPTCATA